MTSVLDKVEKIGARRGRTTTSTRHAGVKRWGIIVIMIIVTFGLTINSILTSIDGATLRTTQNCFNDINKHDDQQQNGPSHYNYNNATSIQLQRKQSRPSSQESVHIMLALSGDHPGFFAEVEISIKSILLNAPDYKPLTIHIMADSPAFVALHGLLDRKLQLTTQWQSTNPIMIRSYNVTKYLSQWQTKIQHLYDQAKMRKSVFRRSIQLHTLGTWFRLMANEVIPNDVQHVLYMDTDVVLLANIQTLWNYVVAKKDVVHLPIPEEAYYLHWGSTKCAGFIILDVQRLPEMWNVVQDSWSTKGADQLKTQHNINMDQADQSWLATFELERPNKVSKLPDMWDNHVGNGLWKYKTNLLQVRPQIGYIHFNGGNPGKPSWFLEKDGNYTSWVSSFQQDKEVRQTFGMVDYYIRLPWSWAKHFSSSKIPYGHARYNLTFESVE